MKMWGGRMSKATDPLVERFNASASFDIRLAKEDIAGSVAWARALGRAGVLGPDDLDAILRGLAAVLGSLPRAASTWLRRMRMCTLPSSAV